MTDMTSIKRTSAGEYSRPALTVFGSVRNLTGGSGGTNGDGTLGMTRA